MLLGVGKVRLHPGPRGAGEATGVGGGARTDCTAPLPACGPRGPRCRAVCTGPQTTEGLRCTASSPGGQQNNREALTAFVSQVTKYRNERRGNRSSQASARGSFLPQDGRRTGSRVPAD